jgi:hypothetical protein
MAAKFLTVSSVSPTNNNSLLDTVKVIKIARLGWLAHLFRMQELEPCRKLPLVKPEGT